MFQRVLVPVDLTEKSLTAVDTACEFAARDRPGHDRSSISYAVAILSPCPVLLVK
jgi:nucleotide-binding universal stress UspA family protein